METSKHTAGNWTFKPSGDANFYFLKSESKPNTWLMNIQQNGELSNSEQIANIELITKSASVANETGKTPRQLADENNKLLNALKPFSELYKQFDGIVGNRPSKGIIYAWHHNKHGESQLASKVKGGGWFRYAHDTNTFVLFGDSTDFGAAKFEDIKNCVENGKVYSDNRLYRNLTDKYNFSYDTGSEVIEILKK